MLNIETRENQGCLLLGLISSNQREDEIEPYKKHIYNHFHNGGGIVYTYSKEDQKQNLDYLGKLWEVDLNYFNNLGRIVFICREDFLMDNKMDEKGFIKEVIKGLNFLKENGAKEKLVYIMVDLFWDSLVAENSQFYYDKLREICKIYNNKFLLRYIIEDLSKEYFYNLFYNHEFLLIDGVDDFETYTAKELLYKSMTLLSRYNSVINKYENEMMRLEYLKTLGELMEGTVHDINNLLITILGYAQLSLYVKDEEEINNNLEIIQNTAMDGKNIINRFQNHIRGSGDSLKELYEFDNIIEACVEMTKHKFKPSVLGELKQLKLMVDLNSNRDIYGNEYELRQAIINIILNGVDAMEGSGTMTIKTYDIDEQTVLEIEDTGKGIDEAALSKIFNPYFSTKGDKGTGLGLNIAKKVFENHGANVLVKSKIGLGTKFTIFFPTKEIIYNIAEVDSKGYNIT